VLWPLTTGNKKKLNIDYAVLDTFRGFLHKTLRCDYGRKGSRGHL